MVELVPPPRLWCVSIGKRQQCLNYFCFGEIAVICVRFRPAILSMAAKFLIASSTACIPYLGIGQPVCVDFSAVTESTATVDAQLSNEVKEALWAAVAHPDYAGRVKILNKHIAGIDRTVVLAARSTVNRLMRRCLLIKFVGTFSIMALKASMFQ